MEPAKQSQPSVEKPPLPVVIFLAPLDQARALHAPEFQGLAPMPPAKEWFAQEEPRQRRVLEENTFDFMAFVGMIQIVEFRVVALEHLVAWQRYLQATGLSKGRVQRKLVMLSALLTRFCSWNALLYNPWRICNPQALRRIKRKALEAANQTASTAPLNIRESPATSEIEIDRWVDGLTASLEALRSQMKRKLSEHGG